MMKCKNQFHVKPQSTKHKKFCALCDSFILLELDSGLCSCCGSQTTPKRKNGGIQIILNKVIRHISHIINAYNEFPVPTHDVKIVVQVYHKGFVYSVPLQAVCRYCEAYNEMNVGDKAEFWSTEMLHDNSISNMLQITKKRMSMIGIGR